MTAAPLLVELLTEELPPRTLQTLAQAFARGIENGLRERGFLAPESRATAFATPRRLAVHISSVAPKSEDKPFKQKLMPLAIAQDRTKNWTTAFLKKLEALGRGNLAHVKVGTHDGPDALTVESDGKADAVFLQSVAAGQLLLAGLQAALDEAIASLPIAKPMSYQLADGTTTVQFVRPAHRLVALHGHAVVNVAALGLSAGTKTFGHRFHSRGELPIHTADTYAAQLEEGKVVASFEERRARIVAQLNAAASKAGAKVITPEDLIDEVTALVEWPVVYESGFESAFLAVPAECLILTMQQNQKYFAMTDANGHLMNRFLLVSNIETRDPSDIVAGNARVVRARLADAKFFFDQDRQQSLESRVPGLASVVYHNKLGSQLERVERMVGMAVFVARSLGVDVTHVERAARLAKADLRTLMVGEFPELQGTMGRYYALHDGEPSDVAEAIAEHYRPRFADDALPASRVGVCVALADKLQALAELFSIGEKATGDKDPLGLRRTAIGIVRILEERAPGVDLHVLVRKAVEIFQSSHPGFRLPALHESAWNTKVEATSVDVLGFLYERLRGLLRERGFSANEVEAVLAMEPTRLDLVPAQLAAVRAFMQLPEAESLVAANKRIGNILKKADAIHGDFDPARLFEPAERDLSTAYARVKPVAEDLFVKGDYTAMLKSLAPLKLPVDRFFDDVMVNVEDEKLRNNRLALLASLRATMNRVADLSRLSAL
ncbi:MAG TPA: glycine--tRNA ligase subunit beta [Burkholderiaceae bacterium]|nr:glycine--tRNA ligase subunit beta [Burkholderiaceae bacterium]